MNYSNVMVLAPHPDDETFGCGGTLLRLKQSGARIHWLIATQATNASGHDQAEIDAREDMIDRVADAYQFDTVNKINWPTSTLDILPKSEIISTVATFIKQIEPDCLLTPFRKDAHSDHAAIYDATVACSKWFRYPYIKAVYAYETQSETDFDLYLDSPGFRPNTFVDISDQMDKKLEIVQLFEKEIAQHPFPRSAEGVEALAKVRGATSGYLRAEAFTLMRQRIG